MMKITCSLLLLLGVAMSNDRVATTDDNTYPTFEAKVRPDFIAGFAGDSARLDAGIAACESVLAEQPTHALAMAWMGSGLVFKCGASFESGDFETGMRLWNDGLQRLDRAVRLDPDAPRVRLRRAETLMDVWQHDPNRGAELAATAAGDVDAIELAAPDFLGSLPGPQRGALLYKTGSRGPTSAIGSVPPRT